MTKAKNIYDIVYEIDENIPGEKDPCEISVSKTILASTYLEALKKVKEDAFISEAYETAEGEKGSLTYNNFQLVKFELVGTVDLFA